MIRIRHGRVVDPMNKIDAIAEVVIEKDQILAVIPETLSETKETEGLADELDATGCLVTPGLIDHHTHLYPYAKIGLPAEAVCFATGVTTAVDAGSCGCNTYEEKRDFQRMTKLDVLAYLNVCSTGLDSLPVLEDVNPSHWDEGKIKDCLQKYPDELVGLKLRTSAPIVKELGYEPLKAAVQMAERLGTHLMVHSTNPPGEFAELLEILRPGDILTHMYMNQGSCLVEKNRVIAAAYRARERGVLFEAADARLHFGMDVATQAVKEAFYPDLLATDLTALSMNLRPTAFHMAMQVSKYIHLGIPLEKVIALCTEAPARQLGLEKTAGSLTVGHKADVAVFRPVSAENVFGDRPYGNKEQRLSMGNTIYKPMLTIKNGEMVYRDMLF